MWNKYLLRNNVLANRVIKMGFKNFLEWSSHHRALWKEDLLRLSRLLISKSPSARPIKPYKQSVQKKKKKKKEKLGCKKRILQMNEKAKILDKKDIY